MRDHRRSRVGSPGPVPGGFGLAVPGCIGGPLLPAPGSQIPSDRKHEGLSGAEERGSSRSQKGSVHDRGPGYGASFRGRRHEGCGGDRGGKYLGRGHRPAFLSGPGRPRPWVGLQGCEHHGFHGGVQKRSVPVFWPGGGKA